MYEQISTSYLPDLSFHEDKNLNMILFPKERRLGETFFIFPKQHKALKIFCS